MIAIANVTLPVKGEDETREFAPVEISQVGVAYRVARQKFKQTDVDPMDVTPSLPTPIVVPTPVPPITVLSFLDWQRKIKMSQVVDQANDSEIADFGLAEHRAFWARLKEVTGGEVRPIAELSAAQTVAFKTRIIEMKCHPMQSFHCGPTTI